MVFENSLFYMTLVTGWIYTVQSQMFELSPMDQMQLTSAVREIVHPRAQPTPMMMAIASRQGAPPATMAQMLEYTPHFVNLAIQMGVRPPGTNGTVNPQAIRQLMVSRGMEWMQRQASVAGMTGGQMGLGSEMTAIAGGLGTATVPVTGYSPVHPMMSAMGQGVSSTQSQGSSFFPLSFMMLDSGMDLQNMALLSAGGMGNPLATMYAMQNML